MKSKHLLLMFALMAMATGANAAEELYVGGKKVDLTKSGTITASTISGGGSVSFDASTKTLTIKNVSILCDDNNQRCINSSVEGLKVVIEGDVYFRTFDAASVRLSGGVSNLITGDGFLEINSKEEAFFLGGGSKLTISVASLKAHGNTETIDGDGRTSGSSVTIENSLVTLDNSYFLDINSTKGTAIKALGSFTVKGFSEVNIKGNGSFVTIDQLGALKLQDNISIFQPSSGRFDSDSYTVCASGASTPHRGDIVLTRAINVTAANFPDDNFRDFILSQEYGKDGAIINSERAALKEIDVSREGIADLKGIELFPNLEKLNCHNNKLTSLNVSKNTALIELRCSYNQLTTLDVTKNTKLEKLTCYYNQLTSLDVSKNTALTELTCSENKIIGDNMFDLVSSLPKNTTGEEYKLYVFMTGSYDEHNIITKTQVNYAMNRGWTPLWYINGDWKPYEGWDSNNIAINEENFPNKYFRKWLISQSYGKDNTLTPAEIAEVKEINVSDMGISSLKGIEFFTELKYLYCDDNMLTELDVSKLTALRALTCMSNHLGSLDLSKNTALVHLWCDANRFTSLDVSNNTALERLRFADNRIESIDLSKNTALKELYCWRTQLTSLDVSKNTALEELSCPSNGITALDLSKNTALKKLNCSNNRLTSLDVSKNTTLIYLQCEQNNIKGANMDALIASLPKGDSDRAFYVKNNNVKDNTKDNEITNAQIAAVWGRGWTPYYYEDHEWHKLYVAIDINEENFPDSKFRSYLLAQDYGTDKLLSVEEIATITWMDLRDKGIASLKGIEFFTELTSLNCNNNSIEDLNLSKNTKLETLSCTNNHIGRLTLPYCPNLCNVFIYMNRIGLAEMEAIVNALPTRDASAKGQIIVKDPNHEDEGNICTVDMVNIAKGKQWNVIYFDQRLNYSYFFDGDVLAEGLLINEKNFPDYYFRRWLSQQDYGKDWVITQTERLNISEIDLTAISELTGDYIESLKGIENFSNLKTLWFMMIPVTSLDLSNNIDLEDLIYWAPITELDVSNNRNLKNLSCLGYKETGECLTSLDLSKNGNLTTLYCNSNDLNWLDLSNNPLLTELNCGENQLTGLDLSNNSLLQKLYCYDNQLTTLDLSKAKSLEVLQCYKNQIKDQGMDQLVASLPNRSIGETRFDVYYSGYDFTNDEYTVVDGNVMTKTQVAAAKKRGWVPYWYDDFDGKWKPYEGSGVDGDVNGDNVADVADIASIISVMAASIGDDIQSTAADVNRDGTVDVADIATVITIMAANARRLNIED